MKLLEPIEIGGKILKNRMAMAPMTRSRADQDGVVGNSTVLYYTQRSSAGLLISEAINISKQATGSPLTPGLYTQDHVDAWKKVTDAVHDKNGIIYAQLWHTGRVGHSLVRGGELPVAPSPVAIAGQQHFTAQGMKDYEVPRELDINEIQEIVQDYKRAAVRALEAGFDGVELHAAFGYLPNQFLAESANKRTDEYGGSHENRNRFVVEILTELVDALGPNKVAVRISPTSTYNSIQHDHPVEQFDLLIGAFNVLPLAYVHIMNVPFPKDVLPQYPDNPTEVFGKKSVHPIVANFGYTQASGEAELQQGVAQLIAYGTLFLANPDLPLRFEKGAPLNAVDRSTMYGGQDQGYIDYPFLTDGI